jgi:ketosteroid isomerase-like protein
MSTEKRNLEVVAELGKRWNAGDHRGVHELYHDEIVMTPASDWLYSDPWVGKEQVARGEREWAGAWEQLELSADRVEATGDRILLLGKWVSKGLASGADGTRPVAIVFTLEDGLIKRFDFFDGADDALREVGLD